MSIQTQTYTGPQKTDGKAVASLILGVASILFCLSFLAGIPAVILGHISKSNIRKSMGRLKGDGMATAGLIMGYVSFTVMIPVFLIIAAIAIPNLLRARIEANESAARATVRTVNSAQALYSTNYSNYARSLQVLGPGGLRVDCTNPANANEQHACIIDPVLGCSEAWCRKGGYHYSMTAVCSDAGVCDDYVVTAMPVAPGSTGRKVFCSTKEGIIRFKEVGGAGAIVNPLTLDECQSWPALQ